MPTETTQSTGEKLSLPHAIIGAAIIISIAIVIARGDAPQQATVFFSDIVADLDIDQDEFSSCLEDGAPLTRINQDVNEAAAVDVGSTPTTVVYGTSGTYYAIAGALPEALYGNIISAIRDGGDVVSLSPNNIRVLTAEQVAAIRPVDDTDHVRGDTDAALTVIEYSDFQCPFCANFHPTLSGIVRSNDVRWVYRHLPLTSIHPQALAAAAASECVATLGNKEDFWEYADYIFRNQDLLQSAPYRS